jgi:hypothetical protein
MNHRLSTLFAEKSYAGDATEIIDLDLSDPISQLVIYLGVTNTAGVHTEHGIACLKKVELVDGSDVLYSLSGFEAEAADIYHNREMRRNWNFCLEGLGIQRFVGINFGRKLWDPELAFDPKKFRNPQLKISLDIDGGGCAPSALALEVYAALFDEKAISPVGFLMHKEIKDYPLASAAHEYTDLPTDFPYRKLFLKQRTLAAEPSQVLDTIKLAEDQDKRIIFNHKAGVFGRIFAAKETPLYEQIIFGCAATATHVFTTVAETATAIIMDWKATSDGYSYGSFGSAGGLMHAIRSTGSSNAVAHVQGWLPHGVYEFPFGDQDDIDDWYDAERVGSLKLDVKAASGRSSSDSVQVFLQQLRRY